MAILLPVLLIVNRLPRLSQEMQIVGTILMTLMVSGLLWLYIKSGVLWFSIAGDGLTMKRPFWKKLIPWSEIKAITWEKRLRIIRVHDENNILFFVSTDGFPQLGEFLDQIKTYSQCSIDKDLNIAIYGE